MNGLDKLFVGVYGLSRLLIGFKVVIGYLWILVNKLIDVFMYRFFGWIFNNVNY